MGRLENKIAIITGASNGMGASHAKMFVEEGAKVVMTDVDVDKGKELANKLGENALFIQQDVSNEDDWKRVIEEAEKTYGPVNILVNNAGISIFGYIEDLTLEQYKKVININQASVFLGMKYVLPSMKKANGGSIVNISSMSGFIGTPGFVSYDASKFAIRGMTKTAALEFANYNIRVNSVHPGLVATPLILENGSEETNKELTAGTPLKRMATVEEISNLVIFLASDESSYCTGSEFLADGGSTAR